MALSSKSVLTPGECQNRFHRSPCLHLFSLLQQHPLASPMLRVELTRREHCFGAATLRAQSLLLLFTLAEMHGVEVAHAIHVHEATVTAAETQAVLSPMALVHKTLCLEIVNRAEEPPRLILLTGIGDFQLERGHRHVLAERLGCFHRAVKRASINPPWLDPVALFGMMPGMVSPFLASDPPPTLAALGVMIESPPSHMTHVAVSLSLFESLLLPTATFFSILETYRRLVLPQVQLIPLDDRPPCVMEPSRQRHAALVDAPVSARNGKERKNHHG